MAENKKVRHVLHRRSNVSSKQTIGIERTTLEVNSPKAPNANAIEYGEIAVNYGDGNEALFIRNSADEIIQLNSIENIRYNGNIDTSLNQYLDERYVNRSGDVIYGDITIQAQEDYNDDPKFKYIGSKFEVNSNEVNEDVNSANIDITEQTYVGEKLNITISKGENCEGEFKINTDNINIDVKCEHNSIIEGNSTVEIIGSETKTVKGETLHTYTTKYTTTATVYNLSGTTTNMEGTTLNVEYDNINLKGDTTIDGTTEINGATTIDGATEINGDTTINGNSVNVNGTTTSMKGTTLNVEYDNINLKGDTEINGGTIINGTTTINGDTTIDGDTINVNGTTTSMKGTTLNVEYDNINLKGATTIDGDTTINGDLVLNPEKTFNGKLEYQLNFKIATSATKNENATLIETSISNNYNNSKEITIGENDPLVTKGYVDDVFENILDDDKITTAIDSFKELQEVLGVTDNGEISSNTYNTVISGINAKVNKTGDTMTGALTVNGGNITTDSNFVGNLNNTLSFTSGAFSATSFNNSKGATVNVPTDISHLSCDKEPSSWTVFDNRYVNVTGDIMSGNLTVGTSTTKVTISTNGTIDATGSIYSSDKKLKKNIKSVSNKDIEAVSKIDLKSYKFINDESERERYGVIAQDLEKVGLNNLVVETDNKKGVDYISFLILKIAQLEKRIEELENK